MTTLNTVLTRGVQQILPTRAGLESLMRKRKITLYQGFDPTAPSLHIGHFIGVRKLAQFQSLGHKVIFLIGDFTGLIGDPSGKGTARRRQTSKEVLENLKNYTKQVERVIDFHGPNAAKVMFNSEWTDKLSQRDMIEIASKLTHQQLIERDMYQERIKSENAIYFHELLYPIYQGYDSVAMDVDLEIGGNDQLFNMMIGRTLMKALKNKDKFVMTMKLLTDSGGKKMGKTDGNAVFLADSAEETYGKVMSWSDEVINQSVESLTDFPLDYVLSHGPLTAKKAVAFEVVRQVHGEKSAKEAQDVFEKTFQKKAPDFNINVNSGETLVKTIASFTSRKSISSAKELIRQNGVDVNNKTIIDQNYIVKSGDEIKVGGRTFLKAK
jgi:tyrosyl-tRNA synthetase